MDTLFKTYLEETKGYLISSGCYFPFTYNIPNIRNFPMYYFIVYADFMYDDSSLEPVLLKALNAREPYLFLETLQNEVYRIEHRDDEIDTYNDVTQLRLFGDCEVSLTFKYYRYCIILIYYIFRTRLGCLPSCTKQC